MAAFEVEDEHAWDANHRSEILHKFLMRRAVICTLHSYAYVFSMAAVEVEDKPSWHANQRPI